MLIVVLTGHSKAKTDSSLCETMFVGWMFTRTICTIAVLNENGKVLDNFRVDNDLSKIDKFFDRLDHNGIVMESSGLWYNICEYLTKKHIDVRLSNPRQEL
ncbi:MAG: hypothetical protein WBV84_07755 [Nitrososphaeraceae archaeon]